MTITKAQNGSALVLSVEGRLDTVTAPDLEKEIVAVEADVNELTVDFSKLDYISSAGLRVLLSAHKAFVKKGGMVVKNVNETLLDIFEVTGFKDILNIQQGNSVKSIIANIADDVLVGIQGKKVEVIVKKAF